MPARWRGPGRAARAETRAGGHRLDPPDSHACVSPSAPRPRVDRDVFVAPSAARSMTDPAPTASASRGLRAARRRTMHAYAVIGEWRAGDIRRWASRRSAWPSGANGIPPDLGRPAPGAADEDPYGVAVVELEPSGGRSRGCQVVAGTARADPNAAARAPGRPTLHSAVRPGDRRAHVRHGTTAPPRRPSLETGTALARRPPPPTAPGTNRRADRGSGSQGAWRSPRRLPSTSTSPQRRRELSKMTARSSSSATHRSCARA